MIQFLKRLFGGHAGTGSSASSAKPPLPDTELDQFKAWFALQRKPAVELTPTPSMMVALEGSRLGGPAWLAEGESWPRDPAGVPLEFLAQLACTDCASLSGYPSGGFIQFFVGRDDLFGMNLDELPNGSALVRWCDPSSSGGFHTPPELEEVGGVPFSDFSPFLDPSLRAAGIALRATPFEDWIDQSVKDMEEYVYRLYQEYDIKQLENYIESEEVARPLRHQTGGYPSFTQSDIRYQAELSNLDHVLLRLTSDEVVQWGDVGEAVFMLREADLLAKNLGATVFSWDCT